MLGTYEILLDDVIAMSALNSKFVFFFRYGNKTIRESKLSLSRTNQIFHVTNARANFQNVRDS